MQLYNDKTQGFEDTRSFVINILVSLVMFLVVKAEGAGSVANAELLCDFISTSVFCYFKQCCLK